MMANYLAVVLLLLSPALAQAAENTGSVSMQVNVLDNTCSMDDVLANVVLGPVALRDIQHQGGASKPVAFSVVLKDCGMYARSVDIQAQGTTPPGTNDALALKNQGAEGTAVGVGVRLLDDARRVVAINQPDRPLTAPLNAGGNTVIPLSAQYVLTGEAPRAGLANAEVTLTFTYK